MVQNIGVTAIDLDRTPAAVFDAILQELVQKHLGYVDIKYGFWNKLIVLDIVTMAAVAAIVTYAGRMLWAPTAVYAAGFGAGSAPSK